MEKKELNREKMDYLKEIATVGFGHAATALSQMINQKVNIEVPRIKFIPIKELYNTVDNFAPFSVTTILEAYGDISGQIMMFFKRESAMELITDVPPAQMR